MTTRIKTMFPKPLLRFAWEARERTRLLFAPRQPLDAAHLGVEDPLVLERVFADDNIAQSWKHDSEAIQQLLPGGGRHGGVNLGDRRAIYYLIRAFKPKSVLEVGTHIGASTTYIALGLKANQDQGRVTTVDIMDVNDPAVGPWRESGLPMPPRDVLNVLGCSGSVTFESVGALPFLRRASETFDLIFLDGDHADHAVYAEVAASLPRLKPGGVILLHDYYPRGRPLFQDGIVLGGPFRALRRVMTENPEITVRPLGNLPWPTKLISNATTLALVLRKRGSADEHPLSSP